MNRNYDILAISREMPPFVLGGISYHMKYLYDRMSDLGHNITIIGGRCWESEYTPDVRFSEEIDTKTIKYPSIKVYNLQFPLIIKKILRDIDLSNYDVVLTHTELPFEINKPVIANRHDCRAATRTLIPGNVSRIQKLVDQIHTIASRRSVTVSDYDIFNSNLCRQYWRQFYSNNIGESSVIHNGVDTSLFYPREGKGDYILHVGGTVRKGIKEVLNFADISSYPVRVVGSADVSHPNVTVINSVPQSELVQMYSDALVTIHPANFEAFGNVVLESLACGTPVVVSKQCGVSEILTDDTGVATDDISEGVQRAVDLDQEDCVALAKKHTWEEVAKRTVDTVSEVL